MHRYTTKNAQIATSLLTPCNILLQQADIKMRSPGLRQLVDDKSVCKLSTGLLQVDYFNKLVELASTSCNKSANDKMQQAWS